MFVRNYNNLSVVVCGTIVYIHLLLHMHSLMSMHMLSLMIMDMLLLADLDQHLLLFLLYCCFPKLLEFFLLMLIVKYNDVCY